MKSYTEIPGPPGASERHLSCQSGKMSAVYPDLLNFPAIPAACGQFLAWSEAVVPGQSVGSPPEQGRKGRQNAAVIQQKLWKTSSKQGGETRKDPTP